MGKVTGFLEIDRRDRRYAPASDRIRHYNEFVIPLSEEATRDQAARCMDCGIPYCHNGCPVNNQIPDWNDLVYRGDWEEAARNLHSTNNFPEFTGRICPAPCEASCTLNLIDDPVTIKTIECAIVDRALGEGWIKPEPPAQKTGKKIAVVGSGPAGLACAQQLARAGHEVHRLREKRQARRPAALRHPRLQDGKAPHRPPRRADEGRRRRFPLRRECRRRRRRRATRSPNTTRWCSPAAPKSRAICRFPGRELAGVHFAMDFLPQQNRRVAREPLHTNEPILAGGKHVVVIGGGDTGSDCIGTSIRQGALSVTQLEIMPEPPEKENKLLTWPEWPLKLRTSSSHEEGAERDFAVDDQCFSRRERRRQEARLRARRRQVAAEFPAANSSSRPISCCSPWASCRRCTRACWTISAWRSIRAATSPPIRAPTSPRSTSVFACGDMRRGQSLVVWAIREGRQAAHAIDKYLMGSTVLPR